MPDVKDIADELDAVCVSNKVIAPPETAAGKAVMADNELLFATFIAITGSPLLC
jgi:hypothetical protein